MPVVVLVSDTVIGSGHCVMHEKLNDELSIDDARASLTPPSATPKDILASSMSPVTTSPKWHGLRNTLCFFAPGEEDPSATSKTFVLGPYLAA